MFFEKLDLLVETIFRYETSLHALLGDSERLDCPVRHRLNCL